MWIRIHGGLSEADWEAMPEIIKPWKRHEIPSSPCSSASVKTGLLRRLKISALDLSNFGCAASLGDDGVRKLQWAT
ncbi:hypothetical protein INR49_009961, partial [Caranx melampygus]